ncbi:MAG: hypothetical protein FWG82_04790, partial [Oscillospiraceae bacterium]|nr:hypothetical protein [Oscillospiraceae bacterium]
MIKLRKITTAFLIVCACALIVFTACNSVDEPQNDLTTTTSTSQNRTEITTGASTSQHKTENTGDQTTSTKPEAEPTAANAVYPKYAQKYAYAGYTPQEAQMDPWYLTLLNVNYCLPEDHPVDIAGAGNGTYLDRRVVPAFKEMVAAA